MRHFYNFNGNAEQCSHLASCCRAKAARKAREAGQSEKRRKMREDLEKREGAWQSARSEEQRAKNKLKVGSNTQTQISSWLMSSCAVLHYVIW